MHTSPTEVLIVGAGPTGLTMACELLRRGVSCRILEKTAAPATTSRAIGLQARSLEVFANMGIVEPALAQGVSGIRVHAYSGDVPVFTLDFRFLATEALPYPYGVLLPQNLTEQILLDLLGQLGGCVDRSREVLDVRQECEQVIATVKHREDGQTEEITSRFLVGCDGAHSRVREVAGLTFEGTTYPEEFLLADVDLDWQRNHEAVHVWLHHEGQFAAMPLPDKHWRLMVDVPTTHDAPAPTASLELFQRLLRERTGDATTTISHPTWLSNFQIHRKLVTSYRERHVFLAGDAAHVHSPFGGQGANTGIQDAFNLAWKLALVIRGKGSSTLLETYQEERRPVAQSVLAGTHFLTSVFYQENPFIRLLRDRVVVPLLKRKGVQHRLLWEASELGINYRRSRLAHTYREGFIKKLTGAVRRSTVLHAGDRAPDGHCLQLPEQEETTLFQVLQQPGVHLLLFDGGVQTEANYRCLVQLARRVEGLFKEEVLVHLVASQEQLLDWQGSLLYDPSHTLHAQYGATVPSLVLIRPDGYIGLLCQPVREQPLMDYLQRLFSPSFFSEIMRSPSGEYDLTQRRTGDA